VPTNREAERQPSTDFGQRIIIDTTTAQPDIERQIVTNLPYGSNKGRFDINPPEITFVGDLGDRANRPIVRPFDDGAQKQIGMLFAGQRRCCVEMDRDRLPPLRQDSGDAAAGPVLIADAG
jgi:hypothetical protein